MDNRRKYVYPNGKITKNKSKEKFYNNIDTGVSRNSKYSLNSLKKYERKENLNKSYNYYQIKTNKSEDINENRNNSKNKKTNGNYSFIFS